MKLLLALIAAAPLFAQANCTYNLLGKPRGATQVFQNGLQLIPSAFTQTGPALQTISPKTWKD